MCFTVYITHRKCHYKIRWRIYYLVQRKIMCDQICQFTLQRKYTCIKIYCCGSTFKTFLSQVPALHVSPPAQLHKTKYTLVRVTLSPLGYVTVVLIGSLFGRHALPSSSRTLQLAMEFGFPPVTCEKKKAVCESEE